MALIEQETTDKYLTPNSTLTSGITKVDSALSIVTEYKEFSTAGSAFHRSRLTTCALVKNIVADAALGFGEHIATFPVGRIKILGSQIKMVSLCPTGLSATAGQIGLGTAIATGAIATLTTATFDDIMDGTTIADHVATVTLTSVKANIPNVAAAVATDGQSVPGDGVSGSKIHLNIASTWNQTAAENVTFQAVVDISWVFLGTGS